MASRPNARSIPNSVWVHYTSKMNPFFLDLKFWRHKLTILRLNIADIQFEGDNELGSLEPREKCGSELYLSSEQLALMLVNL